MDQSFIKLYDEYVDMVYRICLIYLKNIPDTEDAVQDIFIKISKSNKKFKSKEHEKAWIIVVAKNHCKNILSHWWRKNRRDYDHIKEPYYLSDNTDKNHIWQEIISLPDKYKIIIYLYYYEGYDTNEIADILSLNSSTTRTRLSKARDLLKPKLEGIYNE